MFNQPGTRLLIKQIMVSLEKQLCRNCGEPLSRAWIKKGWKYCYKCNEKWKMVYTGRSAEYKEKEKNKDKFSREVRQFYYQTIKGLKSTVSHSRKGKPHKQAWGFHIVDAYH